MVILQGQTAGIPTRIGRGIPGCIIHHRPIHKLCARVMRKRVLIKDIGDGIDTAREHQATLIDRTRELIETCLLFGRTTTKSNRLPCKGARIITANLAITGFLSLTVCDTTQAAQA